MLLLVIPLILPLRASSFQAPPWILDPSRWGEISPQPEPALALLDEEEQHDADSQETQQTQQSLEEVVVLCEQGLGDCSEDGTDCRTTEAAAAALPPVCKSACGMTMQTSCVGQITIVQHKWCQRLGDICRALRTPRALGQSPGVTWADDAAGLRQRTGARVTSAQAQLSISAPSRPLTFMHIPKTAGTLIEEIAKSANITWGMNLDKLHGQEQMSTSGPWTWTCNAYHAPPQYLRDPSVYQSAEVFCVTRHPYDRAVSEYTYLNAVPWGSEELPTGSPPCSPANLNSFLRHKLGQFKRAPHMKFINDCHFLPQSEYIWADDGRQWCQHVLRLEDFPSEFNKLMKSSGYAMKITKPAKANSYRSSCPGLSSRDLGEPTRQLLDEVYAKDFENLGYLHEVAPEPVRKRSLIPTMPLMHLPPLVPLPLLHRASSYFSSLLPAGMRQKRFNSAMALLQQVALPADLQTDLQGEQQHGDDDAQAVHF